MSGPFMGIPTLFLKQVAVTPSDTTVIPATKGLYIGTAGNLNAQGVEDDAPVVLVGISGFVPGMFTMIYSTSTTASNIVAVY